MPESASAATSVTQPGRDVGLDTLRGVAILIVVLSHALQFRGGSSGEPLLAVVVSMSMPLFVWLSGYAAGYSRPGRFLEVATRKANALLVPYVAWGIIYSLLRGLPAEATHGPLASRAVTLLAQGPWYLAAIFVLDMMVRATRIDRGRATDWAKVGVVLVLAYAMARIEPFRGWVLWANVAKLLPFFVAGYLMNLRPAWRDATERIPGVILGAVFVISLVGLWPLTANAHHLIDPLLAPHQHVAVKAMGWALIMGLLTTAGFAGTLLTQRATRGIRGRAAQALRAVGAQSLGIYVIHGSIVAAMPGHGPLPVAASFALSLVASFALSLLLSKVRITRRVLLGGR